MTRALVVVAFVGAWMALGFGLRLDANQYLLLGIPLTLLFQRFVARQPIRALWVRGAPPMRWSLPAIVTTAGLGLFAAWEGVAAGRAHQWTIVAYALAELGGAFAAGYAIARLDSAALRRGVGPMLIAIAISLAMQLGLQLGFVPGPHHFAFTVFARSLVQYIAVTFLVEEVTFRGALDSYVAAVSPRWPSALVAATLWGPWHLPIVPHTDSSPAKIVAMVVILIVVHLPLGVPLAISWRRSGNLWLPSFAHAFIDAVRNGMKV